MFALLILGLPQDLKRRNPSGGVPNASDLAELSLVIYSVNNSIRSNDHLANVVDPIFGNDTTQLWKFLQAVCLGNQFIAEGHCAVGIVAGDEDDYIVKVVASSGRPD